MNTVDDNIVIFLMIMMVFVPNNVHIVFTLLMILTEVTLTIVFSFSATEWVKGKQMEEVVTIKNT